MTISTLNDINNSPYGNIEIHYETIESMIYLDDCDGLIGEVLDIIVQPKVVKKYVFKAPLIEENGLEYGYKLKLMTLCKINIEFTDESLLGQTKVLTHEKLLNITIKLPKTYEDGKSIKIDPTVIDTSSNIINKKKLYLSTYMKFTIIA